MKDRQEFLNRAEFLDKEDLKQELQEFREFALKKNMFELAIAFILGAAFQKVVGAISENLIMPLINGIVSHTGTAWREAVWQVGSVSIEIGELAGASVDFLITAIVLYILYQKLFKGWFAAQPKEKEKAIPVPILIPPRDAP